MTQDESERFQKANEKVHAVIDQWHYDLMTRNGYKPLTMTGKGFVRSYEYTHPVFGTIRCTTGSCGDYWSDKTTGAGGWHGTLAQHLAKCWDSPTPVQSPPRAKLRLKY